jgi:hypothetical protein
MQYKREMGEKMKRPSDTCGNQPPTVLSEAHVATSESHMPLCKLSVVL